MWIPNTLEIVIPAYKAKFLPALLESLASQNSKRFSVIVSDDGSPEELGWICDEFKERMSIRYVRFEENIGASNLVEHWNRSVALSNAEWLLLPGDDDLLEENCVESFWQTVAASKGNFDVYSFGARVIDESNRIIRDGVPAADTNAPVEFIKKILVGEISACPAAYIFSRRVFEERGGFVPFDRGWHSDDATWALFGAKGGIKPIEGAFIRWRASDLNISAEMGHDRLRSTLATVEYLSWMISHSASLALSESDIRGIVNDSICWRLYGGVAYAPRRIWWPVVYRTAQLLHQYGSISLLRQLFRFAEARIKMTRAR